MSDTCPKCGYWISDIYEFFDSGTEDVETECPNCEAPIIITRSVTYVIREKHL